LRNDRKTEYKKLQLELEQLVSATAVAKAERDSPQRPLTPLGIENQRRHLASSLSNRRELLSANYHSAISYRSRDNSFSAGVANDLSQLNIVISDSNDDNVFVENNSNNAFVPRIL
jgi:hypothetical protein